MLGAAGDQGAPRGPARRLDHRRLLTGSAGQSFGAFLPQGRHDERVTGDANDYFGKGLSGGILSVAPAPRRPPIKFNENICVGNVAFYGATGGKGFVNGLAGQRFGVRNSGATIVCEGVGNHGCEYMTGGVALILGEVGQNFAAGMSGGVAFVYDEFGTLASRCNHDMVELLEPTAEELGQVQALIEEHVERTQESARHQAAVSASPRCSDRFVKVVPAEYARHHGARRRRARPTAPAHEEARRACVRGHEGRGCRDGKARSIPRARPR